MNFSNKKLIFLDTSKFLKKISMIAECSDNFGYIFLNFVYKLMIFGSHVAGHRSFFNQQNLLSLLLVPYAHQKNHLPVKSRLNGYNIQHVIFLNSLSKIKFMKIIIIFPFQKKPEKIMKRTEIYCFVCLSRFLENNIE